MADEFVIDNSIPKDLPDDVKAEVYRLPDKGCGNCINEGNEGRCDACWDFIHTIIVNTDEPLDFPLWAPKSRLDRLHAYLKTKGFRQKRHRDAILAEAADMAVASHIALEQALILAARR